MAKYQTVIKATLKDFVPFLKNSLMSSSASCTLEEESYLDYGNIKIAILCFERYSMFGGNRVSMTINLSQNNESVAVVAMSAGGSQATFFKINTVGENNFLTKLIDTVQSWEISHKS